MIISLKIKNNKKYINLFIKNILILKFLFLITLKINVVESQQCGISTLELPPEGAQSVYRGDDIISDGHLPWMAFLLGHAVCTGSVIGRLIENNLEVNINFLFKRQYILSAGHCVHAGNGKSIPAESLVVFVGSANLSQATPISVEKIILRSEYNDRIDDQIGSVTTFDMAILKLATPLNLSETLWPICLSRNSAAMAVTTVETKVLVAGWGNTKPHCDSSIIWKITHPKIPERLQYGRENILPTEECVDLETKWHMEEMAKRSNKIIKRFLIVPKIFSNILDATNFFPALYGMNPRELRRRVASKLTDKICVVSNKTVVESGDSGGPLLLSSAPGKWTQIGTLTGGPCHGKDAPNHGIK
ncbi:unnamed protein product [Meloidogyne enterolobii]|uniref:Uncharacterized protein n=1 Tax=Meloidogyne enterolobii TaxID=390850 RepID=A0ACB0YJ13_MELEN